MPNTNENVIEKVNISGAEYLIRDKLGGGFTGTTAEVVAAIQAGTITEGMTVYITDDAGTPSEHDAEHTAYDNTESGLVAENVQDAVDEVVEEIETSVSQLNSALSGKLSKDGGGLIGSLDLSNGTNDTPEITFTSKDHGHAHLDYYNGVFRILNSDDATKNVQIGSDSLYVNGINVLKQLKISNNVNVAWTNPPINTLSWYAYEGANVTTYNIPHPHCIVQVFRTNATRGVAIAYQWNSSSLENRVWINHLHDTWRGWVSISAPSTVIYDDAPTAVNQLICNIGTDIKSLIVEFRNSAEVFRTVTIDMNTAYDGKYYTFGNASNYCQIYITNNKTQLVSGIVSTLGDYKIRVIACY